MIILNNLNVVNQFAFTLLFLLIVYFVIKSTIEFTNSMDEKPITVKIKNKSLGKNTLDNFLKEVDELKQETIDLNDNYIAKTNLNNTSKQLKSINRKFLELVMREKLYNQKIDELKTKGSDINILSRTKPTIAIIQETLSSINLNEKIRKEKEHSESLHHLSVIRVIFVPMAILVTYFKMKFTSMGYDFGRETKGIWTIKYGQSFVWLLLLIATILVILPFYFNLV